MSDLNQSQTGSGRHLGPEDIANRTFPHARKGVDPESVRIFLAEVAAQVRDLRTERAEFRSSVQRAGTVTSPGPVPDDAALTRALGEEISRVLQTARESAIAIVQKAERQAAEISAGAETIARNRRTETESAVAASHESAKSEIAALLEKTKAECREMIEEARETRLRVLADLADRRRALLVQIEQIRVGKESMIAVVNSVASSVASSIEEVRAQLGAAEETSRIAAEHAASELDAAIRSGEDVEALAEKTLAKIPKLGEEKVAASVGPRQQAPASPRVFDIERELRTNAVYAPSSPRRAPLIAPSTVPASLRHEDVGSVRVPDLTPTVGQTPLSSPAPPRSTPIATVELDDSAPSESGTAKEAPESPSPVDELFAKIRASREMKVADAQKVLSTDIAPPAGGDAHSRRRARPASNDVTKVQLDSVTPSVEPSSSGGALASEGTSSNDGEVIVSESGAERIRRDTALEPAYLEISKALKRTLREDQNLLLDALRNRKRNEKLEDFLPGEATKGRIVESVRPGLVAAFGAGYGFLAKGPSRGKKSVSAEETISLVSSHLADAVLEALNSRLVPGFAHSGDVEGEVSEIVGAAFREWRAARTESLALDYAIEAFGAGEIAFAKTKNLSLFWKLEDSGKGCPDCDDNGVAGEVEARKPFPTGHLNPPAHPGCRCFLSS